MREMTMRRLSLEPVVILPRLPMLIGLILVASIGHAEADPLAELAKGQPKDVAAIAERIAMCAHFGGEEPYDAARQREIAVAVKKYRCVQLDRDEATLRKRYKDNSAVLRVLQKAHEW
ncbi:hypothetical protein GJ700_30255 [Duganella sp. FT92W]|uniref:Uncharacterized protein n=1 Tax=Pseudoduganella rivuli TaxID=2666085 RepID=A0A7X2LUT5_9BURK|nr:hypothetical protein [Pseudoduganella rivuli]MRV76005.1 hypothetical protein [Pseudoduganella rivuli]